MGLPNEAVLANGGVATAALTWKLGVLLIAGVILVFGAVDAWWNWTEQPTISHWLKDHPLWFHVPAGLMLAFLVWLYLHLWHLPPWLGGVQ